MISEVYGGGGNANTTFTNDFIELYNRTASPISLAGWSVQYASAAGVTWQVTPLSGTIPAGKNYLVQEGAGAGGTTPLPNPDATGTIAMSAASGKVALVTNTTGLPNGCPTGSTIIDFVGYGTADCSETCPAPGLTNTTSDQRKGGGATDTNNNANDFTAGAPDPHPTVDAAPSVATTTPAAGSVGASLDSNVTIGFNEPVNVTGQLVLDQLRIERRAHGDRERRAGHVHARPGDELRAERAVHRDDRRGERDRPGHRRPAGPDGGEQGVHASRPPTC